MTASIFPQIGDRETLVFSIKREDFGLFQKLSGDYSLIHTDKEYAQSQGFKEEIAYGGIFLAKLSYLLGMKIPGKKGISLKWSIDYHKPLYIGEECSLTIEVVKTHEVAGLVSCVFELTKENIKIASGKTESLLRK